MRRSPHSLRLLLACALVLSTTCGASAEVVCQGDCRVAGDVPTHDGTPFDFEMGLVPEPGASLDLRVTGSVYLRGPVDVEGELALTSRAIEVRSDADMRLGDGGQATLVADSILLEASGKQIATGSPGGSGIVLASSSGNPLEILDGDPLRLAELPVVSSSGLPLAAGILGLPETRILFVEGDLYLDVSGIPLSALRIWATGDIVLAGGAPLLIPEPATGMLVGLGLVILGWKHPRRLALLGA